MERCVLCIDDNPKMFELTVAAWKERGFVLRCVKTGEEAVEELAGAQKSGREYCLVALVADYLGPRLIPMVKLVRRITILPMLILSTEYHAATQLEALTLGADIYLSIPWTIEEGILAGFALIRRHELSRAGKDDPSSWTLPGELYINTEQGRAFFKHQDLQLSNKEFTLLCYFVTNEGYWLSHEQIYKAVWGDEYENRSNEAIWNLVSRLRSKLRAISPKPDYIQTERYRGYRFIVE